MPRDCLLFQSCDCLAPYHSMEMALQGPVGMCHAGSQEAGAEISPQALCTRADLLAPRPWIGACDPSRMMDFPI